MAHKCPQCGGEFPAGERCRDRFDLCLALDYQNPTVFGAVHFLTVACYMLQHNGYSRDVWLEARRMLAEVIRQATTPAAIRRQNRQKFDSGGRTWRVTKGEKLVAVDAIVWSRTVADVRLDDPSLYCDDVRQWASCILADTEALIQLLNGEPARTRQPDPSASPDL
ncbi:MAG: DUF5946 family protein [Chloroflexota bacterium]|nr:DUF5946 family protein [Chloroflexota bacterium]